MESVDTKRKLEWFTGVCIVLIAVLYGMLRLRFVDHVLTWDEAMNLLSTQAFFAGEDNPYSFWFWRHPPLYVLLLGLMRDSGANWTAYAVLMNVGLGIVLLFVLFRLQRLFIGSRGAVWALFCYSLMPAAMFFDVWIKRDILVNIFGLLALHAFYTRKGWLAGAWLGLGFLSKELALFYAIPLGVTALISRDREIWMALCKTAVVTLLVSGWWYLFFSTTLLHYASFVTGAEWVETEKWVRPWTDVWMRLPLNLGWTGLGLLMLGCGVSLIMPPSSTPTGVLTQGRWWPVIMLVAGLLILTVIKGKTPWFIIPLLPAIAALQGRAIHAAFAFVRKSEQPLVQIGLGVGVGLVCMGLVYSGSQVKYDEMLNRQAPGFFWGTQASAGAAREVNAKIQPGDRWAATPMFYWEGEENVLCPILLCGLDRHPDATWQVPEDAESLWARVESEKMDWVLISPTLEKADKLVSPLIESGRVSATVMEGSILLDCRGLGRL